MKKKKIPISTTPPEPKQTLKDKLKNINRKDKNNIEARYNIGRYRKKTQRKKIYTAVLIALLGIIVIASIFFVYETLEQGKAAQKTSAEHFPVRLTGENLSDLDIIRKNLVLTGESRTILYQADAQRTREIVHELSNPVTRTNDDRVLTYSKGGTTVRLDDKKSEIKTIETTSPILFCELSETGYVAVATAEERYNSAVTIYDSRLKEIYKYNESKNYIDGFNFVSNRKGIVLMHGTENAQFQSIVYGLDFTKDKSTEYFKKVFDDVNVYSVNVKNTGNITLTSDVGFIVLNKAGDETVRYEYSSQMRFIADEKNDSVLALENTIDINQTDLIVLSENGEEEAKTTIPTNVTDIFCDEDGIIVADRHNIYEYSYSLKLLKSYKNSGNCTQVVRLDNLILGIASDSLFRIE